MNGWFITLLILAALGVGTHLAKHGERKNERYNFWGMLIGSVIQIFLIYKAIETGF
jgi:uncharacterized membrane protein